MKDYSLKINGHSYTVQIDTLNENSTTARVVVNGEMFEVEIEGEKVVSASKPQVAPLSTGESVAAITPVAPAPAAPLAAPAASAPKAAAVAGGHAVRCPLPGTVTTINVAVGDKVSAGQTLLILEAMKMENNIDSDITGTVKQIAVQQGATVMEGDTLIVIE